MNTDSTPESMDQTNQSPLEHLTTELMRKARSNIKIGAVITGYGALQAGTAYLLVNNNMIDVNNEQSVAMCGLGFVAGAVVSGLGAMLTVGSAAQYYAGRGIQRVRRNE